LRHFPKRRHARPPYEENRSPPSGV
jgi:hypothetical protein